MFDNPEMTLGAIIFDEQLDGDGNLMRMDFELQFNSTVRPTHRHDGVPAALVPYLLGTRSDCDLQCHLTRYPCLRGLQPKFFKGSFQDPNMFFAMPFQMAAEREIHRHFKSEVRETNWAQQLHMNR